MTKKIETLIDDIYNLFDPDLDHQVSDENLDAFCDNMRSLFKARLGKYTPPASPLRFSALGKHDRQLWFDAHPEPEKEEKMPPKTYVKFLYGDIIEQMLLFLAKEAGHSVTDFQKQVEVNGVKGSIDAVIDGVLVDVKSASPYGYKKFEQRTVTEDDPFGYVAQLSGYAAVETPGKDAAWFAAEKVDGSMCISPLPYTVMKHYEPAPRIEHLKEVVASDTPPDLCHQPVPDGKSGNMKLPTGCSYCKHKFRCHPNLRTFIYSTGPRFLTTVAKVPDVPEVT